MLQEPCVELALVDASRITGGTKCHEMCRNDDGPNHKRKLGSNDSHAHCLVPEKGGITWGSEGIGGFLCNSQDNHRDPISTLISFLHEDMITLTKQYKPCLTSLYHMAGSPRSGCAERPCQAQAQTFCGTRALKG